MSASSPSLPPQFDSLLGPLCSLGSSIVWAFASSIYTKTAERLGALQTNLVRTLIAFPLFALFALLISKPAAFAQIQLTQLSWLTVSTVCSYALGDLVFYMAALRIGTTTALAIASIYPIWATVGGALTLGERVGPLRVVGTLCCILGVVWLVLQQGGGTTAASSTLSRRRWLGGVGLALLTSLFWAGNTYSIRRGAVGLPFLAVNAVRYFLGALALSLVHKLTNKPRAASEWTQGISKLFVITAVIETFGGSSIFVYGLSHSDLSVAAPLSSLAPLFSVPIGLLLGTEKVSARRLLAIVLTVAGVVLLVR